MNKKQLYESIMKNVAREVKKALNESNTLFNIDEMIDLYNGWMRDEYGEGSTYFSGLTKRKLKSMQNNEKDRDKKFKESLTNFFAENNIVLDIADLSNDNIEEFKYIFDMQYDDGIEAELSNIEYDYH